MASLTCKSLKASCSAAAACKPHPQHAVRQLGWLRPVRQQHITQIARAASVEADTSSSAPAEPEFDDDSTDFVPSTLQVQGLLNTLCTETEIKEMHLEIGSFQLKVRRSLKGTEAQQLEAAAAAAAAAAPASSAASMSAPATSPSPVESIEEPMDEGLVYVTAPKVGIFRRGRYAGGKRVGKGNIVNKGDSVKRGQALGFVEQLGTYVACEAPQAGEIANFLVEDGAPVEYTQTIIELAPFFGGHIIGDKKYA